jgi:hypothetical protein
MLSKTSLKGFVPKIEPISEKLVLELIWKCFLDF